jgi:hypothetical protein
VPSTYLQLYLGVDLNLHLGLAGHLLTGYLTAILLLNRQFLYVTRVCGG